MENENPFPKRQFLFAQKGKYYSQKGSTEVHVTWEKGKIELSLRNSRDRTSHVHIKAKNQTLDFIQALSLRNSRDQTSHVHIKAKNQTLDFIQAPPIAIIIAIIIATTAITLAATTITITTI